MSLSREFAAFVADLHYEDLPADVVDRAKGVTQTASEPTAVSLRSATLPAGRG